ncbi:hypothetical protein TIFTF001_047053 [Ficus carica]|uniref:Uncharacterized protein n=1 Tax=Ficus carica TaxID=3494 RepID=A0AA87YW81_FICCA|nr:hypothetical protein TIFTF001_047053 [Ficus carica]
MSEINGVIFGFAELDRGERKPLIFNTPESTKGKRWSRLGLKNEAYIEHRDEMKKEDQQSKHHMGERKVHTKRRNCEVADGRGLGAQSTKPL